jgi:hypothetical protein
MARVEQRKVANIDRGLFLIRYAAAEDEARPPKVTVSVDPKHENDILLVLHPDHTDGTLTEPGSCLVVMATQPSDVVVEVTPSRREGSAAATIKIEPLTQGKAHAVSETPAYAGSGIRVLGHVAGVGDVFAGADEWLGGPSAPSRIEGIAIEWPDKPSDLILRYAVKTAKPQFTSGRMVEIGSYTGTRGHALPIISVLLELSGPRAANYEICAEAIFLGSPRMRALGQRTVLAGPTGREPLVGFRLSMKAIEKPAAAAPKASRASGRVRVFRSKAQSTLPVAT